jgi:hypothetical protein
VPGSCTSKKEPERFLRQEGPKPEPQHVLVLVPFFFHHWGLNSGPTPGATPPAFLVMGFLGFFFFFFFFEIRVLQTVLSRLALNCDPLDL